MTTLDDETARARAQQERRAARAAERELAEQYATGDAPGSEWSLNDDPWAGMLDEQGDLVEIEPAAESAAADIAAGAETPRLFNLPEEFWGSRELFKVIRQQARADGTSPDGVLGAVLARISGMVSHDLKFHSGKLGTFNLFVNIVAPTGIGKTEAMRSAQRVVLAPPYLTDMHGEVDQEKFRDGWGLGSGEGLVEAYMGMVEKDTGEVYRYGPNKGEPKTKPIKAQVRHNAFLFLDEGETLNKMLERRGATIGQAIRTMWTGAGTGSANAQQETSRHLADGSYALGLLIGWQPRSAQLLIADAPGGTPQRFLWLSAIDPDMPEWPDEPPEPLRPALCDADGRPLTGVVHFPPEVKRSLRAHLRDKHLTADGGDELHSHEPLMRCKVAALLCLLDGRNVVDADDWRFAGMIWQVSCAVRDRLVEFGRQQAERERAARELDETRMATARELARVQVSADVERVARRIWKIVRVADSDFRELKRAAVKKDKMGRDKPLFDAALIHARSMGWISTDESDGVLRPGLRVPSD